MGINKTEFENIEQKIIASQFCSVFFDKLEPGCIAHYEYNEGDKPMTLGWKNFYNNSNISFVDAESVKFLGNNSKTVCPQFITHDLDKLNELINEIQQSLSSLKQDFCKDKELIVAYLWPNIGILIRQTLSCKKTLKAKKNAEK
jgi:hypothetical protein